LGPWNGPLGPDVDWSPTFPSADARYHTAYENGSVRVTLFHAAYAVQADGREVISYDNRIEGHRAWKLAEDVPVEVPGLGRWRRAVLVSRDGRRRVVLYHYTIAGRPTASRLEAKLWQGLSGIAGDQSASILAASATCRGSCRKADDTLVRFLTDMSFAWSIAAGSGPLHP
jgi:EpsI family protein